ncbi:MAG: efflux RND transporter periplasmic adaptor subunit [Gammaproteobacteria bacterium]|nr:efflux RND transporter periplasmic adaptor subunit [Gammaproteobacteria bacterium]
MTKSKIQILIAILLAFILGVYAGPSLFPPAATNDDKQPEAIAVNSEYFTCPMHPHIHQDHAGDCPVCGMSLVSKKISISVSEKPEYFTCPMHPHIHQEHEGDCPICGMSLVSKQINNTSSNDAETLDRPEVFIQPSVINNFAIKTAKVKTDSINRNIRIYGYVNQLKKGVVQYLKSPVSGKIKTINYPDNGNKLVKDAVFLTVDSDEFLQLQKQYLFAVEVNDVKLMRILKRKLFQLGFTSSQLTSLVKKQVPSNIFTLRSPATGLLSESHIKIGQHVKSGELVGLLTPQFSISAYAKVFETQWIWLKAGQQVSMFIRNLPGVSWKGEVRAVEDLAQSSTTAVKLFADFEANGKDILRLGMQTEMIVATQSKMNVLQVPVSAVIRTGSRNVVVVAKGGGHFQPVDVETGLENDENVEIISGLTEGMEVVVSGQFLLDSESEITAGISRLSSTDQGHKH